MAYINLKPDHSKPQVFFSNILPHANWTQAPGSLTCDHFSWNDLFEKTRRDIKEKSRKVFLDRYVGHTLGHTLLDTHFWMSLWIANFVDQHLGHFLVIPSGKPPFSKSLFAQDNIFHSKIAIIWLWYYDCFNKDVEGRGYASSCEHSEMIGALDTINGAA